MSRVLTPSILVLLALVLALVLAGCKAKQVDYTHSYNLGPGEVRMFRVSGAEVKTSVYNTGAAELSINGETTDGVTTWERPNLQPGSKEYTMSTTSMVDIEVRNLTNLPGAFAIHSVGKGDDVVIIERQ